MGPEMDIRSKFDGLAIELGMDFVDLYVLDETHSRPLLT